MAQEKPLLVCIVGPTAIGKTKLSIELAQALQTEIISADSRQFFKEMSIGTAVPSSEELQSAPHHFIQNKSIHEFYSVGDFERDALAMLQELYKKHKILILVGGSGLYVDAIINGLDEFPEVSDAVRQALNMEYKTKGIGHLQKELQTSDPAYFKKVDVNNPQRVIRALEVIRSSGLPFSGFRGKKHVERPFNSIYIGLEAPREVIYERINKRVDKMMDLGLLEEANSLLPYKDLNALQTVGYKELFEYFENRSTLEQAIDLIKRNTRRFAKRQGTWFRKNPQINWFNYTTPVETIISFIKKAPSDRGKGQ